MKTHSLLPILALLTTGLPASAQTPVQIRPQAQAPFTLQQLNATCATDSRVRAMNELRANQNSFFAVEPNREDELLKRAAAVVKHRYQQIAQPIRPLGRLVAPPFCGGPTGSGILVQGLTINSTVRKSDSSQFPDFQNCTFIFESKVRQPGSPIELNTQTEVTELAADIRVDLTFDDTAAIRRPSRFRPEGTAAIRFDVHLTSDPYVLKARPNVPPPISFSNQAVTPPWGPKSDPEALGELHDIGVENNRDNRLTLARRAIEAHETGVYHAASLREEPVFRPQIDMKDPCGETQPFRVEFTNLKRVLEERCYTYTNRMLGTGAEREDIHYRGQLRILFERDFPTSKIIGIRAFSFGGNI